MQNGQESRGAISRRNLRRGALIAGGAVLGAAALPGVASAALPTAAPTPLSDDATAAAATNTGLVFFTDPNLDFNARFPTGAAGFGSAAVGEAITAINAANAAGGTIASFVDAFRSLAERTEAYALEAAKAGDKITAREAHLRAAGYYAQVLFFILGTATPAEEPQVYAKGRANWEAYGKLADTPIIKAAIPNGKSNIPACLMRPDTSGKARPTVIVNNGSDAQTVEMFAYGGAAAIERGYNALLFEGPGQGAMLFERKTPFRYDWEKVITPIVDWLEKRSDVDNKKIVLTGWSLGGELVGRAAAYEHRLAAVVADPGFADNWLAWPEFIRKIADSGDAATQNANWNNDVVPGLTGDLPFRSRSGPRSSPLSSSSRPPGQGPDRLRAARRHHEALPLPGRGRQDQVPDPGDQLRAGPVLRRPGQAGLRCHQGAEEVPGVHRRSGRPVPLRPDGAPVPQRGCLRLAGRHPGSQGQVSLRVTSSQLRR